jgi:hypothetical protein
LETSAARTSRSRSASDACAAPRTRLRSADVRDRSRSSLRGRPTRGPSSPWTSGVRAPAHRPSR